MRTPVIAANWKMHGNRSMLTAWFAEFSEQHMAVSNVEVVVCPAFPYLQQAKERAQGIKIGAQDVSEAVQGAFTGQVSAGMLKDSGCDYVIIGHSERRAINHESDLLIAQKVQRAIAEKLIPILCVGETLAERQADKTQQVVARQLTAVLATLSSEQIPALVIAYEPVWAIGTGLAATAAQAQSVHAFLRAEVSKFDKQQSDEIRIIYGGSVKPENALALLAMPDIDGALVGGASLQATAFAQIIQAAIAAH